jgi:hypothetical protein
MQVRLAVELDNSFGKKILGHWLCAQANNLGGHYSFSLLVCAHINRCD